ncbi:MAG: hypothetical protein ACLVIY_07640 [Anaerobutyricum soehngenii]
MKTRRLFYEDVYIQEFEAIVLSCEERDGKIPRHFKRNRILSGRRQDSQIKERLTTSGS